MTAFDINHNGYLELNEQLLAHVSSVGTILDTLNTALKHIPNATQGQATPLWQEQQNSWNGIYMEMQNKLNLNTLSSINVHEIFKNGDNAGAQIMSS
jgi:hypothetical protein